MKGRGLAHVQNLAKRKMRFGNWVRGKLLINMNNKIIRKINKKINYRELLSCKAIE
jgi:hypothetical protein